MLLDPNTAPELAIQASNIIAQMERWHPSLATSKPPESVEIDKADPFYFVVTNYIPTHIRIIGGFHEHEDSNTAYPVEPSMWQKGDIALSYCRELTDWRVGILAISGTNAHVVPLLWGECPGPDLRHPLWVPVHGIFAIATYHSMGPHSRRLRGAPSTYRNPFTGGTHGRF